MPKRTSKTASSPPVKPPAKKAVAPKKQKVANGHKLPELFPAGEILTGIKGEQWILGKQIGTGGFGRIYLASDDLKKPAPLDAKYVIKVEHHTNGPLFAEMHFYHRVGRPEDISEWMKTKKLKFLGMPRLMGYGSHEYQGIKHRFLVIQRFGDDLQILLSKNQRVFPVKTVFNLGLKVLDVLEYIHSHGYIHGDVKASNLMTGFGKDKQNEVYLIDFGLACRYRTLDGVHKEYKEDLRKAHDGTIEFTSRDAHIGVHSRRGDLEILAYNLLQWLCGRLPWENDLKDQSYVSSQKTKYMKDIPKLMQECFATEKQPQGIAEFFKYIVSLKFEDQPDYDKCRTILKSALKANGFKDDGQLIYVSKRNSLSPSSLAKKRSLSKASRSGVESKLKNYTGTSKIASESMPSPGSPARKKIRGNASARPGLNLPSKPSNSPDVSYACGFTKPTPAMLEVLRRKAELIQNPELANFKTRTKRSKAVAGSKSNSPQSTDGYSDYNSDDNVIENIKPKVTSSKKRTASSKPKAAPSFKTKRRRSITPKIKLNHNNICSL